MAKKKPIAGLKFNGGWDYAAAPESKDHIRLQKQYDLFINGKFVAPKSGKYFDTINPATEAKLASVAEAGADDVDLAVKAARLCRSLYDSGDGCVILAADAPVMESLAADLARLAPEVRA